VLLDVARLKGVECLEDGYPITVQDLEDTAGRAKVKIERGDILVLRTGQMGRCLREKRWGTYNGGNAPGISFSTAGWLHEKEIAGIASDTWGVEVRPNELPGSFQPLHPVTVVNMGLMLGEIFYVEELAAACAQDKVFEFLFVGPPLPITGGSGSPLSPMAIL
jgi:kynurenine formamidase